ncbi:hypothetical protein AOLI_G00316720 [Acnodon oligacanthus]
MGQYETDGGADEKVERGDGRLHMNGGGTRKGRQSGEAKLAGLSGKLHPAPTSRFRVYPLGNQHGFL